jgi:hypothetical protein
LRIATSPVTLDDDVVVLEVLADAAAVEAVLLLLPHAARTNAPKLAPAAEPAIFRNRLRSESSLTSRSMSPTGCGGFSSLGELDIFDTSAL